MGGHEVCPNLLLVQGLNRRSGGINVETETVLTVSRLVSELYINQLQPSRGRKRTSILQDSTSPVTPERLQWPTPSTSTDVLPFISLKCSEVHLKINALYVISPHEAVTFAENRRKKTEHLIRKRKQTKRGHRNRWPLPA